MVFLLFLLKGLVIGFSVAAPVGPIGLLVINRTLTRGWSYGAATGFGAAAADMVYGLIAAFGLSAVSEFLLNQKDIIGLLGGFFLCWLAFKTFAAKVPTSSQGVPLVSGKPAQAFLSAFALCLTNPMTILSFVAIFAGAGLVTSGGDIYLGLVMAFGVFAGAAIWHTVLLSGGVSLMRHKLSYSHMRWINRISGLLLLSFGVFSIFNVFKVV